MKNQAGKFKLLTTFFFIYLLSVPTFAQNRWNGFAFNPKVGYYSFYQEENGFVTGLEFNKIRDNFIVSASYPVAQEFILFNTTPIPTYNQIDILLGKYKDLNNFRIQYQGGD